MTDTHRSRRLAWDALARRGLFVALLLAFILVPFALWEGQMNEHVQRSLQTKLSVAAITLAEAAAVLQPPLR